MKQLIILTGLFLLAFLAGCGGAKNTGPVVTWEGTVTYAGKPLPADLASAVIQVRPSDSSQPGMAMPTQGDIVDGRYRLVDVPKGAVTVEFRIQKKTGRKIKVIMGDGMTDEIVDLIPRAKQKPIAITADKTNRNQNFDL